MRKSFTRLFKVFMLLCMLSLQVVAQGATFGYTLSPPDGSCSASRTGDFIIDFNRNVYPNGLGVFALSNQFGTEYMTVQVPASPGSDMEFFSPGGEMSVLFDADKVYVKLHGYTLSAYTPYYITVTGDAVKDGSGTLFDGLEDYQGTTGWQMIACEPDNTPDWDFTTMREGDFAVSWFNPADEEDGVSTAQGGPLAPPAELFEVKFNRPIYWAETGAQGSAISAYPSGWLKDGYFALYKATDGFNSEYGGDVVAHILKTVSITGDLLQFTFSDGYALDPNAEYYLRVRTDIIEDQYGNPWDGVNTNYEWNWRTKDGVAAKVKSIAWSSNSPCSQPTKLQPFVITFDDGSTVMTTNSLKVGNNVTVTTSTIMPYITVNGTAITSSNWSVAFSASSGDLLVTVTPKSGAAYTTGGVYSIGVLEGLLDEGGDPIAAYTKSLTAGDYTAPVSSTVTANADGTTFDILGRLDEAGTIYYIVVTKASTTNGSTEDYWMPTVNELYNAIGDVSYVASRGTTTTSDDHTVPVIASGQIVIGDPSLTYHERVTGLPQSHGTYYEVYYLAFDDACEGSNSVSAATAHATNNATGVLEVEESTLDILPPYVEEWSAEIIDPNTDTSPSADELDGCSDDNLNGITGIKRMGAIYVTMNEAVERAAGYGQAIENGSQVEAIFTVTDGGTIVGLNASLCTYDAATFTFTLVPDSAFKSGLTVNVAINPNTIQDAADDANFGPNGTELLGSPNHDFCVEDYIGPVAICEDTDNDGLVLWSPADGETLVPSDESIVLAWDQQLFAPVEDEDPAGTTTTISNSVGSSTFIGRYIRIRSGSGYTSDPEFGGSIVYQFNPANPNANLDKFSFHFENTTQGAIVTIDLLDYEYASETWYRVEIESGLQTAERISLDWDDPTPSTNYTSCSPYNYYMTFQSRDNIPPVVSFFEDGDMLDPTTRIQPLEGAIIGDTSYILVIISEWIQLGFDGFRDLSYTDTIIDANALRPYFTLKDPDGDLIPFDMKYFSLDISTGEAGVYIDPYNYPNSGDEFPNWVDCEEGLEVCFLGGAGELNPLYAGDILQDDAFNGAAPECDVFEIYCEPTPTMCLESITVNGIDVPNVPGTAGKDYLRDIGDIARLNVLTLDFEFGGAMDTVPGQLLELWSSTGLVATIPSESGRDISPASTIIRYQFILPEPTPGWIDNEDYFVVVGNPSMTSTSSVWDCTYPEAEPDTAVFFHTIDGTAPVITEFVPDQPATGNCLLDKDSEDIMIVWDEPINKGSGMLELWRIVGTGNTQVVAIDVADFTLTPTRDTMWYDVGELYNGVDGEFCDLLMYNESYFFHMPAGFVTNDVGLENAGVTSDSELTFCTGDNPPPYIECANVTPLGDIDDVLPVVSITFSEPVTPIAGRRLQIHEQGSATDNVLAFDVAIMTSSNGGMTWSLNTADWLPLATMPTFTQFEWGQCYDVNLDTAAFRDVNFDYTDKIVTFTTMSEPNPYGCAWEFCLDDNEAPDLTFWPVNNEKHVAVNAHLYAYIDDEPWVYDGSNLWPLVVESDDVAAAEVKQFFQIEVLSGTANCGGTVTGTLNPADWTLEFVGTDKQHLRFTVYDPNGHDFDSDGGTNNPTMQDEAVYRLSLINGPGGNWLCDSMLNDMADESVQFTTEDICDPTIGVVATYACDTQSSKLKFTATMNEAGTVRWEVKNSKTGQTVTGEAATNSSGVVTKEITGLNGIQGAYDFTVKVWGRDDETDDFDEDSEILAEWPWDGGVDDFPGEEMDRIRDFIPALPGGNGEVSDSYTCTLCDDDDPEMVESESYPEFAVEEFFPLNDSIVLVFNETVQVNDDNLQGWSINLRDYENNIGVPLAFEVLAYDDVDNPYGFDTTMVVLYPLDTSKVGTGITQQLIPLTSATGMRKALESERRYYLEIDRYAISDDGGCGSVLNYYPEVVGKALWFKTTDETAPCLKEVDPEDGAVCVDENADITVTFRENNTLLFNTGAADSLFMYIYRQSTHSVPHERIPLAQATITDNGDGTWDVFFPTSIQFRSNETYIVRLPSGIFKDNFGNVWDYCNDLSFGGPGYTWSFTTVDYLPPVPSTTVHEHMSYLDVVLDDDEYGYNIYPNLASGTVLEDLPEHIATSSYFKIEFDEEIYIKNTEKPSDPYLSLWDAYTDFFAATATADSLKSNMYLDDIYELITITKNLIGSTDVTTLLGPNYTSAGKWIEARDYEIVGVDPGSQSITVWVYNAEDHWSPLNTQVPYGFDSNSEYHIALNGGIGYDYEDCDPVQHHELEADPDLLTIVTRDDIPPTLTIYDGDNVVCSSDCDGEYVGPCSTCVNAEGPLRLQFNTVMVQTPYVGIDYDDYLAWESGDVNWWTEANLSLREELLMQPNASNEFLRISRLVGASYGSSSPYALTYSSKEYVTVDGIDVSIVDGKTTIDVDWHSDLVSEGYYMVEFLGGTVKDQDRIPDGNVFLGQSCVFRVEDNLGPEVTALSPDNDPDLISPVSSTVSGLWITYDQPLVKGSGQIEVRWMHGQQNIVIDVEDCILVEAENQTADPDTTTTDNNVLYIPFPAGETLADFRTYYVIVPEGVVYDINACHPIPSETINLDEDGYAQWVFQTADATPPIALEYIPNNVRDEFGNLISITNSVPRGSNLSIRFDENITLAPCSTGGVFIYHNDLLDGFNLGDDFGNFVEFIPFNDPTITISGSDIYHGFTQDVITFDPENMFENSGMYVIRVSGYTTGCGITDFANLGWDGVGDSTTWTFTVTNDLEPMLATIDPPYNHTTAPQVYATPFPADDQGWAIADELVMTFTDDGTATGNPVPVAPNTGSIKIYEYIYTVVNGVGTWNQELWTEIDINDLSVGFDGNTVTVSNVKLRDDINGDEFYYVIVDPGAIINANSGSTAFFAGIGNAFVWRFQTAADDVFLGANDILSPNLVDDGEDAQNLELDVASLLQVDFNEGIEALDAPTGMLQVFAEGVVDPVTEVKILPAMCDGNVLTVELAAGILLDETNYNVVIQAGALGDTSTVSTPMATDFGGVGVWEFQTGDNTPPAPTALSPAQGDECVLADVEIVLTFADESHGVTESLGSITLKDTNNVVIAELPVSGAVFSEDGSTVTFAATNLPDTTVIVVEVPDDLVQDGDPHSPLPNVAFSWTFKTGENAAPFLLSLTPAEVEQDTVVMALEFNEVVAPVAGLTVTVGGEAIDANDFVTADGGFTWTVELEGLESETTYEVVIAEGAFVDVNLGCIANPVAETTSSFAVKDIIAPLAIGSPTSADDYIGLQLNIQFTDAVATATGNIVIYSAATDEVVETIAAADYTAKSNGDSLYTYTPTAVRYGLYYILIDAGAFVDADAAPIAVECPGIADPEEWTLAVIDPSFVDCYNIITPQRAQRNVPVTTTISIDFCDERIAPGTREDRFVTVADQAEEQVEGENFFNYQVVESMISGNTLTIEVSGLKENTTYSIIIAPGAITDEAGNEFAGITDANKWIFTTGDATAPTVTLTSDAEIINDGTGTASITSTELGTVYLAKDDVAPTAAGLEAAITAGKAVSGTIVAANVPVVVNAAGLEEGTYKAYAIDPSGNIGEAAATVEVKNPVVIPVVTIAEIQGEADESPLVDQIIITSGVVTAVDGNGYYIQDANAEWSGVYVYDRTNNESVERGSAVKIQATVAEYNGITELSDVTSLEYVAPMVSVEALEVTEVGEAHEGLLVEVLGRSDVAATITSSDNWTLTSDGGASYTISLYIYEDGDYVADLYYQYKVTGVVYGGGSAYKVEPRDEYDILNWSRITGFDEFGSDIAIYPNPFDKYILLNVSSNVVITKAVITNIAGQLVKEVINPNNTIPTSELRSGVYFISLHTVDGIAKTERIIKR